MQFRDLKRVFRRNQHRYNEETLASAREADRLIAEGYNPRQDPAYQRSQIGRAQSKDPKSSGMDYGDTKYALVEMPAYVRGRERMSEQGANLLQLDVIIQLLLDGEKLPRSARPHKLGGDMKGIWECHIKHTNQGDDWVLLYRYDHKQLVLYAINTGTHKDCGV